MMHRGSILLCRTWVKRVKEVVLGRLYELGNSSFVYALGALGFVALLPSC
jgi:hypothetical protein